MGRRADMLFNQATVLAVATLCAVTAGGGVIAVAQQGAPAPSQPIPRAADGHFWVEGDTATATARASIHFLVDTGASTVALSAADAARLGLSPDKLVYSRPVFTAQGQVQAAPVTLSRIVVAGTEIKQVKALVLKAGPATSLLGMSYLGRLSRIEATPDAMVLRR